MNLQDIINTLKAEEHRLHDDYNAADVSAARAKMRECIMALADLRFVNKANDLDMTTMRRVIIESPYAGNVRRNVAYARAAIRDSIMRGEAPFASHLLYTQPGILNDDVSSERMLGINVGLEWTNGAHSVAFYVDFDKSQGMKFAEAKHKAAGRVIEYRNLPPDVVSGIASKYPDGKGR